MVRIGLWRIHQRRDALVYVWICVGLGVASIVGGFFARIFFIGGIMFLAALWYYQAIRWVDHHSGW
jgi:hypothetical protein